MLDLRDVVRRHGVVGAVAGVTQRGSRSLAAAGLADAGTGRELTVGTPVRVASLTKPIVATAVVLAGRDDPGALDRPVLEWLPELRDRWRASPGLTLRHLLSHTSGLHRAVEPELLRGVGEGDDALPAAVAVVVGRGQAFRPGAAWEYCNAGFWLAGAVLARMRDRTFEDAVRDIVLGPAGMDRTGFANPDDGARGHRAGRTVVAEYPRPRRPSGGLWSTAADLLGFAEFLLADGELVATLSAPVARSLFGSRYGLGVNVAGELLFHDGDVDGFRARLVAVPARRYAAVVVGNDAAAGPVLDDVLRGELRRATGMGLPWRRPSRLPVTAYAMVRLAAARAIPFGRTR